MFTANSLTNPEPRSLKSFLLFMLAIKSFPIFFLRNLLLTLIN